MGKSRPTGHVSFAFTDIEGSTRRWAADPESMAQSLEVHDRIVRSCVDAHHGYVFATGGDGFGLAFPTPNDAIDAVVEIQSRLASAQWPSDPLRVRVGLHCGVAHERDDDYFGPVVNLTARLSDAGHGTQVIATVALAEAAGVDGRRLGEVSLRDVPSPIEVIQLDDGDHPPLRVAPAGVVSIPTARSSIVGRHTDLRAARTALVDHRLVTLVGPGGTGKTRLSIAVAEAEVTGRPDGVIFVDLTQLSEGDGVGAAVAAACQIPVAPDERAHDRVLEDLPERKMLLIIDNCEHVIDAVAALVDDLLSVRGTCAVLATSREAIDVEGEFVISLPPLGSDGSDSPAAHLFRTRSASAGVTLSDDPDTQRAIVDLCARLDGLPLAVELAAARTTVLAPQQILQQLDDRGLEALDRSTGRRGRRSRSARRSLTETIAWSYDLLDDDEQQLFETCAIFPAHFFPADLAAACGWDDDRTISVLESLVVRSLVVAESLATYQVYRLLETLRTFAAERLHERGGEQPPLDRLSLWVVDHYRLEDPKTSAQRWQTMFVDRPTIERCHEHARSLGDRSLEEALIATLAAATVVVVETRRIDHLIGDPSTLPDPSERLAAAAVFAGDKAHQLGDRVATVAWYDYARKVPVPLRQEIAALKLASAIAVDRPDESRSLSAEWMPSVEQRLRTGEEGTEYALNRLLVHGMTQTLRGELDDAITTMRRGLEHNAKLDYVNTSGQIVIHFLAGLHDARGEHDTAEELFDRYQFIDHTLDAIHHAHVENHELVAQSLRRTKGLLLPGPTGPLAYDAVLALAGVDAAHGRDERAVELILRAGWVGFANCVLVTWARKLGCFDELAAIEPDPRRYRGLGQVFLDRVDDYIAEAEAR